MTKLLCCLAVLGAFVAMPGAANAKQCVWNKSGFVLKALWYKPSDVIKYTKSRKTGKVIFKMKKGAKPLQVDVWPTLQGRCTRGANQRRKLSVVLAVVGGKVASEATKIGVDATAAAVGAVGCMGSAGAACPAVAAGATAVAGATDTAIPDGKDIIRVMTPPTNRYVDVWGTVWSPQVGLGGPIH